MGKRSVVFVFFISFVVASAISYGQTIEKGDEYFSKKDYQNALSSYFLVLRQDKSSAMALFKIGYTYLQTETRAQGITFLEKAYKIDPEVDFKILFYMGIAYQSNLQYVKAKQSYEGYKKTARKAELEDIDARIKQCIVSHGLLSNPIDVLIENAGASINSVFDDFAPIASPDGNSLIFSSNRRTDSLNSKTRKGYEDIYLVSKNDGDEWSAPKKIGGAINMGSHDAAASLSPDGKTLFLYYDINHGDIYYSKLNDKGQWDPPIPLNKNINTPLFRETSASISADGKKLFFSSNRPGGKGGLDIYMSLADESGNWGKPFTVGNDVNTPGDEDSPFIHPDGVTLYFSSDGHPGMGSSDIFKSNYRDGFWKKPENLGYPLNSIEYDGFFNISPDKSVAYFATKRKYGVGGYDILKASYRANYPDVKKPAIAKVEYTKKDPTKPTPPPSGTFSVKGKVLDKKSTQPLHVKLSLVYVRTKRMVAQIESDPKTGDYEMQVAESGKYILTAESEGYLFNSLNIEVPQPVASKNSSADFQMVKADVGSIMVLKNVFFDTNKADLKPSSVLELEKIRELLVNNPKLKVQINGHTDNVGDPVANKGLSLKRALAVVNHLALNGIDMGRLTAKGFGSEKPVASNDDEKGGREFNRRTEIEITDTSGNDSKM